MNGEGIGGVGGWGGWGGREGALDIYAGEIVFFMKVFSCMHFPRGWLLVFTGRPYLSVHYWSQYAFFMFVSFPCLPLPDFPSKPCIHGIYYTWYILLIICILIYTTPAAVRGIVRSIICIHKHLVVYRKKRRHIIYTCTYLYICTYVHTYLYI